MVESCIRISVVFIQYGIPHLFPVDPLQLSSSLLNGLNSEGLLCLGMFPLSQLPDSVNMLLIRNENVWDSNRFWKITFSDPSFLKQLLLNQISADSTNSAVSCYSLKQGHYYVVETERYSYEFLFFFSLICRGTSIAITNQGYGLYSCYNNHLAVDTNLNYFADH